MADAAVAKPVAVGLVGAGPWAHLVHAPVLAAGPETRLVGVWARRAEAADALASRHGSRAFDRYDQLLDACEAVAFAVPPAVQAELATQAAGAGRAVLLEKPLADNLAEARRLVAAVSAAGVVSQLVLTWRYAPRVRAFLDEATRFNAVGGRGAFISGALLGGMFATPWRLEKGALLDLGPHVVDLLDAALGPVTGVRAHGHPLAWVGLLLTHEGGRVSEASLCATSAVEPSVAGVELYGPAGVLRVDGTAVSEEAFRVLRHEFAYAVRSGEGHPLDARHGLRLQQVLTDAAADLAADCSGRAGPRPAWE